MGAECRRQHQGRTDRQRPPSRQVTVSQSGGGAANPAWKKEGAASLRLGGSQHIEDSWLLRWGAGGCRLEHGARKGKGGPFRREISDEQAPVRGWLWAKGKDGRGSNIVWEGGPPPGWVCLFFQHSR